MKNWDYRRDPDKGCIVRFTSTAGRGVCPTKHRVVCKSSHAHYVPWAFQGEINYLNLWVKKGLLKVRLTWVLENMRLGNMEMEARQFIANKREAQAKSQTITHHNSCSINGCFKIWVKVHKINSRVYWEDCKKFSLVEVKRK